MPLTVKPRTARTTTLQEFADLLEASKIEETLDLGTALVYGVSHPVFGSMTLINTASGINGVMYR